MKRFEVAMIRELGLTALVKNDKGITGYIQNNLTAPIYGVVIKVTDAEDAILSDERYERMESGDLTMLLGIKELEVLSIQQGANTILATEHQALCALYGDSYADNDN